MRDSTVEGVRAKLLERSKLGLAKYGTTVAGNALPQHEWLRHAQEEALDLAVYLQRIIDDPSANDNLFKVARKHCVENQRLKTEVKSLSAQLAEMKGALEKRHEFAWRGGPDGPEQIHSNDCWVCKVLSNLPAAAPKDSGETGEPIRVGPKNETDTERLERIQRNRGLTSE